MAAPLRASPPGRIRLLRSFERAVLGFGMNVVAFFIERRLVRAIQKGEVQAAPRTGAESDEYADEPSTAAPSGEITTLPPD